MIILILNDQRGIKEFSISSFSQGRKDYIDVSYSQGSAFPKREMQWGIYSIV